MSKAFFQRKGISYNEVDISKDIESKMFLVNNGFRTVPQIFKNEKLLVEGGWAGLQKLSDEDIKNLT
jgi:glutaredoxin